MSTNTTTPERTLVIIREHPELLNGSHATKHFTWRELLVHRTPTQLRSITLGHLHNLLFLAGELEKVRAFLGNRPITITSGWRDYNSNKQVGGARFSQHRLGKAVDIVVKGLAPKEVQQRLEGYWQGGMGYGRTFTHLDTRSHIARFKY
jgi:hypothetical protein